MGPISEYETKVIPKLLNNAESWLGLDDNLNHALDKEIIEEAEEKVQVNESTTEN